VGYIRVVLSKWGRMIAGPIFAALGILKEVLSIPGDLRLGRYVVNVWLFLALVTVLIAQFLVYRDIKKRADTAEGQIEQEAQRLERMRTATEFEGETVRVWELVTPGQRPIVKYRTFRRCTFMGPALIALVGRPDIDGLGLGGGSPDELLWEVPAGSAKVGEIAFYSCTIRQCESEMIGWVATPEIVKHIRDTITHL
jgi:hypothetical protein